MQLAQFNIGRLRHDLDDPRVADFVNGVDILNRIAERADGFVWKYETGEGGVVETDVDGDPRVVVNMTVWNSAEQLKHYVWNTLHKHFYGRRGDWFEPMDEAHFVMWHVPDGHEPTLAEALQKLAHLRAHGDSAEAFGWARIEAAKPGPGAVASHGSGLTSALAGALTMLLPAAALAETVQPDTVQAGLTRNAVVMPSQAGASIGAEQRDVNVGRREGRSVMVPLVVAVAAQGAGLCDVLCRRAG